MSLVYITHHDENIYDMEKERHVTFNPKVTINEFGKKRKEMLDVMEKRDGTKILTNSKKSAHKTMGYAVTARPCPSKFLRKNGGVKWRRERVHVSPVSEVSSVATSPYMGNDCKCQKYNKNEEKVKAVAKVTPHKHSGQGVVKNARRLTKFVGHESEQFKEPVTKDQMDKLTDQSADTSGNRKESGVLSEVKNKKKWRRPTSHPIASQNTATVVKGHTNTYTEVPEVTSGTRKESGAIPHPKSQRNLRVDTIRQDTKKMQQAKNFVKINANVLKGAVPKVYPLKYVDQETGTPRLLKNSGLCPLYSCAEQYAKLPPYIKKRKEELVETAKKAAAKQKRDEEISKYDGTKQMPSEEREYILNGIKKSHADTLKAYLCSSLVVDTLGKRQRKAQLEEKLAQQEKDIALFESNTTLWCVVDSDDD